MGLPLTPASSHRCCVPPRGWGRRSSSSLSHWAYIDIPQEVDLPCFHRATSIALERIPFVLRAQAAGGEFPALQTLSLKGGEVDLGALLSLCPYLRVLRLKGSDYSTMTFHSTSLHELVMEDMCNFRTHRVDIVAPILKQLKMYLLANAQVSISILAPMMAL
ncbi:hypothetical protein ZWY2020_004655 [Hordeum vulgare]|nr:hypothetical protein ZWY2020_004655 [Hordeum vulgare]